MSLKKNLVYNSLLSFSQVLFPLISIPYLTRVLHPDGLGRVSFVDSLTYYFVVVAEFGIVTYGIKQVSRLRHDRPALQKLVAELLSLHVLVSLVSIAIYTVAVLLMFDEIRDVRYLFFSFSFLLVNSFACEWYFWGTEEFRYITLRSFTTRLLGLISVFVLVNGSEDALIYYAIMVCASVGNMIWNTARLFSEVPLTFRNLNWRRHLPHLRITYLISLVYSVVLMLDNVVLQLVSVSSAVAFYAYASRLVRLSTGLVTDSLIVFYPRTVSLAYHNENERLQATVLGASQLILLATVPMAAGILFLAEPFTVLYFGKNFLPVASNLRILAVYPVIKAFSLFLNKQLLMSYDREKDILRALVAGAIVFVALGIPLSYKYSDKGTCVALVISEAVVLLMNAFFVRRMRSGLRILDVKSIVHAAAGSLLFWPVIRGGAVIQPALPALLFELIACVLVYVLFLVYVVKNETALLAIRSLLPSVPLPKKGGGR